MGKITVKAGTGRMKSLSESSFLRYFTFSALYVAQGIPEGILIYALPAWLAKNGFSPAQIGSYVGIIALPWSFKLINGPLMDRFTYLPMGRRRPWVLFGQVGILVSFVIMSFIQDPTSNIFTLTFIGFILMFFSAFQDVAVDGLAIDILPINQQARANGLMWGSKTAGIALSVAIGSTFINKFGFSNTILSFSFIVFLIMLLPLFLRERPGEKVLPWTSGEANEESKNIQLRDWKSIFRNLINVFFLPMSFIMGVAVFFSTISRGLIDTVLPLLTVQELGWLDTEYSRVFATSGLISGAIGMLIGGFLIDYLGKIRMMAAFLVLLMLLVGAFSSLFSFWDQALLITGFIIAFYTLFTLLTIAIFATAMQLSWKIVAATQFTLYMAISNLGLSLGAFLLGLLKQIFSYQILILVCILASGIALFLLQFIKLDKHEADIKELENNGGNNFSTVVKKIKSAFIG